MNIKEYLLLKNKNICEIDLNFDNSDNFLDLLTQKIKSGFNLFIISFSHLNDSFAFSVLKNARQLLAEYDVLFLIRGRIDFAISLKADGAFLDDTHLNIESFKEILDENFIIASSANSPVIADIYTD